MKICRLDTVNNIEIDDSEGGVPGKVNIKMISEGKCISLYATTFQVREFLNIIYFHDMSGWLIIDESDKATSLFEHRSFYSSSEDKFQTNINDRLDILEEAVFEDPYENLNKIAS